MQIFNEQVNFLVLLLDMTLFGISPYIFYGLLQHFSFLTTPCSVKPCFIGNIIICDC